MRKIIISYIYDKILSMTLKEAHVRTEFAGPMGRYYAPVLYANELRESTGNLIFNSIVGDTLPYLFVGYFRPKTKPITEGQWYFANARKHEEMQEAVCQAEYPGQEVDYFYGQLVLGSEKVQGEIKFRNLLLHTNLPGTEEERKMILRNIFHLIRREELRDFIDVNCSDKWAYIYVPDTDDLAPIE